MRQSSLNHKSFSALLLITFLFSNLSAFTQTKRSVATPTKQSAPSSTQTADNRSKKCGDGWSGTVTYTKTLRKNESGTKGGRSWTRTKDDVFQASFPVRADRSTGSFINTGYGSGGLGGSFTFNTEANVSMNNKSEDSETNTGEDICDLTGKKRVTKTCKSGGMITENATGAGEGTAMLNFHGKTFTISLAFPSISGEFQQTSNSSCSGTCSPIKPIDSSRSNAIKPFRPASVSTDEIAFNTDNPGRISGSWTRKNGDTVETFEYNLAQCAPPLRIENITFAHHRVPDPNTWRSVDPMTGTTDGNLVKIKARVFNGGGETVYANVKFSEIISKEALPNGTVSVSLKPGESRDVEYEWDTNGYAWNEGQAAASNREIKAELEGDSMTSKIKILPKPVILVHGLWSNAKAWAEWQGYLREAHSFAWDAFPVGEDTYVAKMSTGDYPGNSEPTNTVFQNSQEVGKQIKFVREQKNAWHVDIVAHSMGGLISRHYINTFMAPVFDGKPEVSHLVMLGTPNMGSPCADLVGNIFEFFEQNDMNAMRELRPSVVAEFNSKVTNRKNVKFSILIGYAVPRTCQDDVRGDGVVPVMSARYNIADRDYAFRDHISLTDDVNFKRFVLPRIAIGPTKARSEQSTAQTKSLTDDALALSNADENERGDRYGFNQYFQKASYRRNYERSETVSHVSPNLTTRQQIKLQGKETKEIEIPANADAASLNVILSATSAVVATLKDQSGATVGESKGGLDAVKNPFRTINVEKTSKGDTYKLKLENFGTEPTTVYVGAWSGNGSSVADFTVEAGKRTAAGNVPLIAKLMQNSQSITNAKITARIGGQSNEIIFYDDGKHDDTAANDGIYGATVEKLPKGDYYVEATAEINGQTKIAVAGFSIGAASPASVPAKTSRPLKK